MENKILMNISNFILGKINHARDNFTFQTEIACFNKQEILNEISTMVFHLNKIGIKPGHKILVSGSLNEQYWITLIAVWSLGGIIIPIDPKISQDQFNTILEIAKPHYLCGNAAQYDNEFLSKQNDCDAIDNNNTAAILFTSGSTGTPKGVVLSHQSLIKNCFSTLRRINLSSQRKILIATNYHYTSTLCHFLAAILSECSFLTTNRLLMQSDLVNLFLENECTAIGGSPIHLRWVAEGCLQQNNSNLLWAMSSGDYLSPDIIDTYLTYLPNTKLYTVYGLTELAGRFCILPAEELKFSPGSVGRPIDCLSLRIVDENGISLEPEQEGEIIASGETLMDGYLGQEAQHGEFKTGDIGYLDKNNRLYLSGRKDDVFKCAGQKISLIHIQQQIHKLNLFKEFAVLPVPDMNVGHLPCLFYVLENANLEKSTILKRLREVLTGAHCPKKLIPVSELPRLGSGKLNRKALLGLV